MVPPTLDIRSRLAVDYLRQVNLDQWKRGPADSGHRLIADSHGQRDADGGEYTIAELQNPSHPYRRLFRSYASKLTLTPIEGADAFPAFGEH